MNRKFMILVVYSTIFLTIGTICAVGQKIESGSLKEKNITLTMNREPLGKVFRELMIKYDIAIGFEESTFDREHNDYEFETILPDKSQQKIVSTNGEMRISITTERSFSVKQHWITVSVENKKLENVLDIIVGQMENYKWEINDDVVNILPIRGRDINYEGLMKVSIKDFHLERDATFGLIRNEIFSLPEINKFLDEHKIFYSSLRPDPEYINRRLPIELNFSGLSFRDLLNKITKVKRGGWILKQNKLLNTNGKEYIEISI